MYQQNEKELSGWLFVNNQPAAYMHKKWWENLNIEHLFWLFQSNNYPPLHIKINQYLINKMKLSIIPYYDDSDKHEYRFWLSNFFILKQVALIIGLLLQDKPTSALMFGKVYHHVAQALPIKKVRYVIANRNFIAGQVFAFSKKYFNEEKEISVREIEKTGKTLLVNTIPAELKNKINLLFSPELTESAPIKMDISHNQRVQIQHLIKRLIRLCGFSDKPATSQ